MSWMIEAVQVADVDPDAVFRLYADPSTWVAWGHNATRARSDGPLAEGGVVHVRANYGRDYPCRIRRFEPGRALELEVRPPFFVVINIYEVEPAGSGARVRHALEFSGPLSVPMRRVGIPRVYRRQLTEEVAKVIALAVKVQSCGSRRRVDARSTTAELTMAGGPGAGPRAAGHERTECWIGG